MTEFPSLVRVLAEADVRFIIAGGFAATLHGSARLTQDLDVVYDRSSENLAKLAAALGHLDPKLRGAPADLPFKLDVPTLQAGLNFTLATALGALDLLGGIAGGGSYGELLSQSIAVDMFGVTVRCLSLDQLIITKRAAGRPRDLDALAELEIIREEHRRR